MATKAREEYHAALQRNDLGTAQEVLDRIRENLASAPQTAETKAELANLAETQEMLMMGKIGSSRKLSHWYAQIKRQGRSSPPPKP